MTPKHNIARIDSDWLRIIKKTTETPYQILKRYSKRKSNKSTFSTDKRRFNWLLRQKREDKRETTLLAIRL